ncbi:zinc transporter 3 [Onychomys torridus]|uniref:zinc transporter 3 n=1 Tax=Onychomys torridus TaxID=38674 RepID=UPI00167F7221|nr:zinc transporter 3 [Onychomys torridus]
MEPSPATGGSETTRLVSAGDRGSAGGGGGGGGLRLKSLFTEPSEPLPEEPKLEGMAHHHCHKNSQALSGLSPERLQARRQLYAACAVCLIFMAGEVVGGYLAHSLAIMTDAAHLLADVGSMVASLFSLWLSTRPATRTMTFGWLRSETLGALASVISLWMVTGVLLYLAFNRLLHSDYHIEAGAMLLTASIAVCANMLYVPVWGGHQVGSRVRGRAFFQDGRVPSLLIKYPMADEKLNDGGGPGGRGVPASQPERAEESCSPARVGQRHPGRKTDRSCPSHGEAQSLAAPAQVRGPQPRLSREPSPPQPLPGASLQTSLKGALWPTGIQEPEGRGAAPPCGWCCDSSRAASAAGVEGSLRTKWHGRRTPNAPIPGRSAHLSRLWWHFLGE